MTTDKEDELKELYTKLTKQQLEFVHNYIAQDFKNASLAYQKAYPDCSVESSRSTASRALTDAKIKRCITIELENMLAETKIPLEKKILETYVARAFYDPADIVNESGDLVDTMSHLREKGLSICIVNIDKQIDKEGGEHPVYRLADREKALDQLQKYIQMIRPFDAKVAGIDGKGDAFSFAVEFLKPENDADTEASKVENKDDNT